MPLSPELLQMLMEDEEVAPRFGGGPDVGYPSFRPEDLREADEPDLSFPEQANERSTFGSRFLDTFADSPTNYQTGPGQSPLMIALASAMNSGSRGLQQRRLRERENSPSNPANKLSLARLNSANAKTRLEEKRYQSGENRATRNERRADRTLARLEKPAVAKVDTPDWDKPRPGETDAAYLKRLGAKAAATRAPEKPAEPKAAPPAGTSEYSDKLNIRTIEAIDEALPMVGAWTAGFAGAPLSMVPGTPAFNLKAKIDNITSNIAFNELKEMRAASKTGGALGAVSDKEMALLSAVEGALQQAQSPAALRGELNKAKASIQRWEAAKAQHVSAPAAGGQRVIKWGNDANGKPVRLQ